MYIWPFPLEPPRHLPPHPTPLGWHRNTCFSSLRHSKFQLAIYFTYDNSKFPCYSLHTSHPLLPSKYGGAGKESWKLLADSVAETELHNMNTHLLQRLFCLLKKCSTFKILLAFFPHVFMPNFYNYISIFILKLNSNFSHLTHTVYFYSFCRLPPLPFFFQSTLNIQWKLF